MVELQDTRINNLLEQESSAQTLMRQIQKALFLILGEYDNIPPEQAKEMLSKMQAKLGNLSQEFLPVQGVEEILSNMQSNLDNWQRIFEQAPSAMMVVDKNNTIIGWNKAAEQSTGYKAEEILGTKCYDMMSSPCKDHCSLFDDTVSKPLERMECMMYGPDGTVSMISKNCSLVLDEEGNIVCGVEVFKNINSLLIAQAEAALAENKFSILFEQAPGAMMMLDLEGNITDLNPALTTMLDCKKDDILSCSRSNIVDGQSHDLIQSKIQELLQNGQDSQKFESKLITNDGQKIDVLVSLSLLRDNIGKPVYFIVQAMDITEQITIQKRLLEESKLRDTLMEQTPMPVFFLDENGKVWGCNENFASFVGDERDKINGHIFQHLFEGDLSRLCDRTLNKLLNGEVDKAHFEFQHIDEETGNPRYYIFRFALFNTNGDNKKGVVGIIADMTKQGYEMYHDRITGLPNKVFFEMVLNRELERITRNMAHDQSVEDKSNGLGVLFIDLDDFKEVNDTYGHDIGDKLLAEVGIRMKACLRKSDLAARRSGDEFFVLLQGISNRNDAMVAAKKILEEISRTFVIKTKDKEGIEINISASIGMSLVPEDGFDAQGLMQKADDAMYQAKHSGKSMIV